MARALEYARGKPEVLTLAQTFASKIEAHDFRDSEIIPGPLAEARAALRSFVATSGAMVHDPSSPMVVPAEYEQVLREDGIVEMWRKLALHATTFEDVWQEWDLPTRLGSMLTAPASATVWQGECK